MAYKEPKKLKKLFKNYRYLKFCAILLVVMVVFIFLNKPTEFSWQNFVIELLGSLLFSCVGITLIDIGKNSLEQEVEREEMRKLIWDMMMGNDNEHSIINMMNKDSVNKVIENCLSTYCHKDLACEYINYIAENCAHYRKDFKYDVCISNANNVPEIEQELCYEKHFVYTANEQVMLRCFFATSVNGLNAVFNREFFFREEILSEDLRRKLKTEVNKDAIIDLLNLELYIEDLETPIASANINMLRDDNGITFETPINEQYLHYDNADKNETWFKGKVKTSYVTVPKTQFLCIFAEPIIGHTQTELSFDKSTGIKDVANTVDKMVILAHSKEDCKLTTNGRKIKFETHKPIFPKSGIIYRW
ncbi:MAG: hypothetical protein ACI308_03905 [Muribaculaceae bacterium]